MSTRLGRWVRLRATYLTYSGLALGLRRLPEPLARLSAAAVALAMLQRRNTSATVRMRLAHLRRVFRDTSGRDPDPKELRTLARKAYLAYARYWVDGARLPIASPELVTARLSTEGLAHLDQAMAAGKGVVMALPHVGSWEWGGAWLDQAGYHMTSVAEVLEPKKLFEWFIGQREASGLSIVPLDSRSMGVLTRRLREGGLVGLLCDRDLLGNGVEVEFFGERTTFPGGPATLALRTGAILITTAVYGNADRNHHAVVSAPIDTTRSGSLREDVARITQEIARHFEDYIRRAPEQWHMFQPNWPSDREAKAARHR